MSIEVFAKVECDLGNCNSNIEIDTDNEDYADTVIQARGWVFLPESGAWACKECVKKYGGKDSIIQKDLDDVL